jgi:hypothetical protein
VEKNKKTKREPVTKKGRVAAALGGGEERRRERTKPSLLPR